MNSNEPNPIQPDFSLDEAAGEVFDLDQSALAPPVVKTKKKNKAEKQPEAFPIALSYADKQGIFFDARLNLLYLREGADPLILAEFSRTHLEAFKLIRLSPLAFSQELEKAYASVAARTSIAASHAENIATTSSAALLEQVEDLLADVDDAPVIRLLNVIFFEAIREGASDIHFEPYEEMLAIRFRLDGVLREHIQTQVKLAHMLSSRIKVMARLDIAEKRVPQDGRITLKLGNRMVDLRVSTMPTNYGERVVLRLLDKSQSRKSFEIIGMPAAIRERFSKVVQSPNGIVLVTGPTGSGKTTTLYAAMETLNKRELNVMTVEDPLEYYIQGVSQTQVNVRAGLTFARGLRAILRQDPDVVMIGEIRDKETAEIAVQASLTGHLVFSTIHTNSALGSVTRLRDMGLQSYLLASSMQGVLAQRLVRKLCSHCHRPRVFNAAQTLLAEKFLGEPLNSRKHYVPARRGCEHCHHTGYEGRIGVFEFVAIDDKLRGMIGSDASEAEMGDYVFGQRQDRNLAQTAFDAVLKGQTTLEEALRITTVI